MYTPYQWNLRDTLRYEVLKQRMGAASAPSHHYRCGAAGCEWLFGSPGSGQDVTRQGTSTACSSGVNNLNLFRVIFQQAAALEFFEHHGADVRKYSLPLPTSTSCPRVEIISNLTHVYSLLYSLTYIAAFASLRHTW